MNSLAVIDHLRLYSAAKKKRHRRLEVLRRRDVVVKAGREGEGADTGSQGP